MFGRFFCVWEYRKWGNEEVGLEVWGVVLVVLGGCLFVVSG